MDNQHRKIDLMNAIKAKGAELLDIQQQVVAQPAGV